MLARIDSPEDIKNLSQKQIDELSQEIRKTIIDVVGKNGGHLASNLGVVELTIALHRVFNSPQDAIIWDVSHQCYAHKLLTGRYKNFSSLRQKDGISGFTNPNEDSSDYFISGHASTSISSALGLLVARKLQNDEGKVIAVIGDGALTGGLAFEGLCHAGQLYKNLIVILNDNQMSIDHNDGVISRYLSRLSMSHQYQFFRYSIDKIIDKIPLFSKGIKKFIFRFKRSLKGLFLTNNLFTDLGFEYVGPLDGHDEKSLEIVLQKVKNLNRPVVVHVVTKKGKGYSPAENNPEVFHGVGPFCISDGTVEKFDTLSFTEVFSNCMIDLADKNEKIVGITAAMAKGTGLSAFSRKYPNRFFDVGIAEEHAVTFAGGLAVGGMIPVVCIYSTFIQRSIDQIIHDVTLQNAHVIFMLDRAGAVPSDGVTHQGIFDLSFLNSIPNIVIMAPKNFEELEKMIKFGINLNKPVFIRYPRGEENYKFEKTEEIKLGKAELIKEGTDLSIIAIGKMVGRAKEIANLIPEKNIEIINARFLKPLDEETILKSIQKTKKIITIEDNLLKGGLGSSVIELTNQYNIKNVQIKTYGYDDIFVEHGKVEEIENKYNLNAEKISKNVFTFTEM